MDLLLPPISASLGAMGSLAQKLDALLDTEDKDEMGKLGTRLLELSKARDPPVTARIWMKDVRELSYDMENFVDTEEDWIYDMSPFMCRVKEANARYERYRLDSVPSHTDVFPIIDHCGQKTDLVVGLHDKGGTVDRLCHLLTDGDEKLKVLSIVGVGGIGKTTLAKQLWHEHKLRDYFHCRAFVQTAKKPDMRRILRSILAQVRPHQPPDASEVGDLIHDLTEHLQDKRRSDDKKQASVELRNDPLSSVQKKIVFKIADTLDDRGKQRALKALSKLHGVDQLVLDAREGMLTVEGGVDPVAVVGALRKAKFSGAQIISVGPHAQVNKPEGRQMPQPNPPYWYPPPPPPRRTPPPRYVFAHSAEEDPNSCVIQ